MAQTAVEEMSRDELERYVRQLQTRVDELEGAVENEEEMRRDLGKRLGSQFAELRQEFNDALDRIDDVEDENKRLRERLNDSGGKDAKVRAIVDYADNARNGPAIKLTAKEIKGAAGCSRRYAYDLIDDLPEEYDWFLTPKEMSQYGSLEIDNHDEKRLGVDFEGVHSAGVDVNKFTTPDSEKGGEE